MFVPALVMLGLGFAAAGVLAIAARVFYVEIDPRISQVEDALPGANCGGCGFSGCSACAEAIVAGKAQNDACIAGGASVTAAVAGIMGGAAGSAEPRIARHRCTGGDRADRKYDYDGAHDCRAMFELHGGDLVCKHGCLGLGTCVRECPFDALVMNAEGVPEVVPDRCTGCGTCERVCPTDVIKVFRLTDSLLHFNNDNECAAPCKQLCPAQIDIPRYVDLVADGKYAEAIEVIKERNPLPLVCGRVCPAPCEAGCRRSQLDDSPVHHNFLKRYVADWELKNGSRVEPVMLPDTGKKVAIIGGGPCGLSAAYYLRRLGHHPKIFDSKPALGGMMRYGIPEYRLPKKVLDAEINSILELGVDVECDVALGKDFKVADLERDYDAILMAMGAWDNSSLRAEGEDLDGVWKGTEFLEKRELGITVDLVDKEVVVVGGGNTAMDACRSALRMGAKQVTLLYRRTRKEMPANEVEIVAGEEEGINYHFLAAPTRLLGDEDGKLKQIEYLRMELGEPDSSGRRRPVAIEGSETLLDVDVVIAAIGQRPRLDWYTEDLEERGLKLTKWNTIIADEETLQSDIPNIFTGGDLWSGPALLIDAIGTGRRAARSIHLYLNGEDLSFPAGTRVAPKKVPESAAVQIAKVSKRPRTHQKELPVAARLLGFEEVDLEVTPEQMRAEADRCLRCGTLCYFDDAGVKLHTIGKPLRKKIDDLAKVSPE